MPTNEKLRTYDAGEVQIIVAGVTVEGFADGDFITIEDDEDAFSLQIGTDGEGARSKTNNRGGTMTISTLQTSAANTLLSALHNLDRNSPGGAGIGPFLCKDGSGNAIYAAEKSWIQKRPSATFGREAQAREWLVRTNNLKSNDAGNE